MLVSFFGRRPRPGIRDSLDDPDAPDIPRHFVVGEREHPARHPGCDGKARSVFFSALHALEHNGGFDVARAEVHSIGCASWPRC